MKNCLVILPRQIFPIVSGYSNKNYNLLMALAKKYKVRVIIITTDDIIEEEKKFYIEQNINFTSVKLSRWKMIFHILIAFCKKEPLQIGYYYDKSVQQVVDQYAKKSDICIAALVRTWKYLEKYCVQKEKIVVFDMVDSIALNYKNSKEKVGSFFWKFIYGIEENRLLVYENKAIQLSQVTYLFNAKEYHYWKDSGNVSLLPHGVEDKLFTYEKVDRKYFGSVAFIGKMNYQPNIDAMLWYIRHIHVNIGTRVPLVIVGAYPTKELEEEAKKIGNVTVTGFVEDPYIYLNSALAVIAPMQTGGGIQNKVLEGMALGKVTIVTSLAADSMVGIEDGKHLLIANSPEEFQKKILEVADSPDKFRQIGMNAKDLIKLKYTWGTYAKKYVEGIEEVDG